MRMAGKLFLVLSLFVATLNAGTIHEVVSKTYTQTAPLSVSTLATAPSADTPLTVYIYIEMPNSSSLDSVCAKVRWTDSDGPEQTSGAPSASDPLAQDACAGFISSTAGKRVFPVLLKANQNITIETLSTNTIPYTLHVQVVGY